MGRGGTASTLFPYTTLFRSADTRGVGTERRHRARGQPVANAVQVFKHAGDRKSTRLNSSHEWSSYAVFCLKKKITPELRAEALELAKKYKMGPMFTPPVVSK